MSKVASVSNGVSNGKVTEFNSATGMAQVTLSTGGVAEMHAAAFFSGRPARLPAVGDAVVARVKTADGRIVVVVARPAAAAKR